MPRRCSMFGCRSNYDGENESFPTFSLPKDLEMRENWIRVIPTDISKLKLPIVCIKHFQESDIVRVDRLFYKGEYREYPRERPKLIDNAIPTVFDIAPNYLCKSKAPLLQNVEEATEDSIDESYESSALHRSIGIRRNLHLFRVSPNY